MIIMEYTGTHSYTTHAVVTFDFGEIWGYSLIIAKYLIQLIKERCYYPAIFLPISLKRYLADCAKKNYKFSMIVSSDLRERAHI